MSPTTHRFLLGPASRRVNTYWAWLVSWYSSTNTYLNCCRYFSKTWGDSLNKVMEKFLSRFQHQSIRLRKILQEILILQAPKMNWGLTSIFLFLLMRLMEQSLMSWHLPEYRDLNLTYLFYFILFLEKSLKIDVYKKKYHEKKRSCIILPDGVCIFKFLYFSYRHWAREL